MQNEKEKFKEDFKKRIRILILRVISLLNLLPKTSSNSVIGHQLIRSITSIGGNYIEAQASSSKKEFTNYFQIALKSCVESQFWIEIIIETNQNMTKDLEIALSELKEISNIFGSSILRLKGKK